MESAKNSNTEANARLSQIAQTRLAQMTQEAEHPDFYGTIGVEIPVQAGKLCEVKDVRTRTNK